MCDKNLVGEELAVAETEVRESGHATENVHETLGRELGRRQVELVYA